MNTDNYLPLIAEGHTEKVLDDLFKALSSLEEYDDILNDVILLSADFKKMKKENLLNLIVDNKSGFTRINAALIDIITTIRKKERKKNKELGTELIYPMTEYDYDFLSTLIIYNFGDMEDDNNTYHMNSLRVSSVRFLREGDIQVITTRRSLSEITSGKSVSHPITSEIYQTKEAIKGKTKTMFHGVKKGQQEIIVVESNRTLLLNESKKIDAEDNIVVSTLFKLLKSNIYKFAGTRFNAPTHHARLLIYFAESYFPDKIEAIQINMNGSISHDSIIVEKHSNKRLWIIECTAPKFSGGLYVIWKHEIKK